MRWTRRALPRYGWLVALVLGGWGVLAGPVAAQGGPQSSDSSVGYIDNAIPGNIFRFRADAAYRFQRPTRGEFFYAATRPLGPGLPLPESNIDYQDLTAYLKRAWLERFSTFFEVPVRFLNPTINDNHTGLSDMTAGFKYAFVMEEDTVASLQLRVYAPTGAASRGLGTHHVSMEPSLLVYRQFTERLVGEGELRYWVPVGGTEGFAGDVFRYGLGLQYHLWETPTYRVSPVIEGVGWTFLNGQASVLFPSGLTGLANAAGNSIFNLKMGVRIRVADAADVYAGYGRALTGATLYQDTYRLEFRLFY